MAETQDYSRPSGPAVVCTATAPCEDCRRKLDVAVGALDVALTSEADRLLNRYQEALSRIARLPAFTVTDTAIRIAREALSI